MADIFVSYAHADRQRVAPLVARLEQEGWSVWWDRELVAGDRFAQSIDDAIRGARCVVVAWSHAALASSWVQNEALEGLERGVLAPVLLDTVRVPVAFRQTQAARLPKWPKEFDPRELHALIDGIGEILSHADGREPPVPGSLAAQASVGEQIAIVRQRLAEGATEEAVGIVAALADAYPDDPDVERLWLEHSCEHEVLSEPSGARVFSREYAASDDNWRELGSTPMTVRLPHGLHCFRFELEGHDRVEFVEALPGWQQSAASDEMGVEYPKTARMQPSDGMHDDMVFVPGGDLLILITGSSIARGTHMMGDYFIDRFPVTNAQFKEFVDAGGYSDTGLWEELRSFDDNDFEFGKVAQRCLDATGRPAPAGWRFANFPEGRENYPVTGVSWFEAAAFARFRGGQLPTAGHWNRAAREYLEVVSAFSGALIEQSNFGPELQPVTQSAALGAFGVRDVAGNAREWVRNPMQDGFATLGGAHTDESYMFLFNAPLDPWRRDASTGFRTMQSLGGDDPWLDRPIHSFGQPRDFSPVSDEVFDILSTQFAYTRQPARTQVAEMASSRMRRRYQHVTLIYPDGGRLELYLGAPANAANSQPVVIFPGQGEFQSHRQSRPLELFEHLFELLIDSGRTLVWPIYHGCNERYAGVMQMNTEEQKVYYRDAQPVWRRELGRALDYIGTRTDLNAAQAVFLGSSYGIAMPLPAAIMEPRFTGYVLVHGGLVPWGRDLQAPIADMKNFLPRLTKPTLLLSGRFDTVFPSISQSALFERIGTDPTDKEWAQYDVGHGFVTDEQRLRIVEWLDRLVRRNEG